MDCAHCQRSRSGSLALPAQLRLLFFHCQGSFFLVHLNIFVARSARDARFSENMYKTKRAEWAQPFSFYVCVSVCLWRESKRKTSGACIVYGATNQSEIGSS